MRSYLQEPYAPICVVDVQTGCAGLLFHLDIHYCCCSRFACGSSGRHQDPSRMACLQIIPLAFCITTTICAFINEGLCGCFCRGTRQPANSAQTGNKALLVSLLLHKAQDTQLIDEESATKIKIVSTLDSQHVEADQAPKCQRHPLMARNLGSLAKFAFSSSLASKPIAEPSGPIVATVKAQVPMGLPYFPGN